MARLSGTLRPSLREGCASHAGRTLASASTLPGRLARALANAQFLVEPRQWDQSASHRVGSVGSVGIIVRTAKLLGSPLDRTR